MSYTQKELFERLGNSANLCDIQKYLNDVLSLRGFDKQDAQDKMLLLTEEIGELAKAVRKSATSISIDFNRIQNYDTVESEVADVFIVLISLCNVLNINIYNAFLEKEKENIKREWK